MAGRPGNGTVLGQLLGAVIIELNARKPRDAARRHRRPQVELLDETRDNGDRLALRHVLETESPSIQRHQDIDARIVRTGHVILAADKGYLPDLANLDSAEIDDTADGESAHRLVIMGLDEDFIAAASNAAEINERQDNGDGAAEDGKSDSPITRVIVVSHRLPPG